MMLGSNVCKLINTDQINSFMPVVECAVSLLTEQQQEQVRVKTGEDAGLIVRHMDELFKTAKDTNYIF